MASRPCPAKLTTHNRASVGRKRDRAPIRQPLYLLLPVGFVAQISIIWDSRYESSVIAGVYGQLDTYDVQDPELGRV